MQEVHVCVYIQICVHKYVVYEHTVRACVCSARAHMLASSYTPVVRACVGTLLHAHLFMSILVSVTQNVTLRGR